MLEILEAIMGVALITVPAIVVIKYHPSTSFIRVFINTIILSLFYSILILIFYKANGIEDSNETIVVISITVAMIFSFQLSEYIKYIYKDKIKRFCERHPTLTANRNGRTLFNGIITIVTIIIWGIIVKFLGLI